MNWFLNLLVGLRMGLEGLLRWRPFVRMTRDPGGTQMQVLQQILTKNQETRFGREHGFAQIRTPQEYAARVPIQNYEDLRPYLERQEETKSPELLSEQPFMYAQTSGTTGEPKYIPITEESLTRYQRSQRIFSYCHYSSMPGLFSGKFLAFVSPAIEGRLPTGTAYGSMSGLIYQSMPWLLRQKYLVPPAVFECTDHELKYLLIATFAMAERSITYSAGANPSTFLKIAGVIRAHGSEILVAIETGVLPGRAKLEAKVYETLQKEFRADPKRAEELSELYAKNPFVTMGMLWPKLVAVSCWREGSCRVLLPELERELGGAVPILELGYLSSECRGSIPVDSLRRLEVPTLHDNFFEFVERSDWETDNPRIRSLGELQLGQAYYVIITTRAGLYRYFMNDIVVVDGKYEQTPTIKFLEKGAGVTNITGEKLYESQLCTAVESMQQSMSWSPIFFVLLADAKRQSYCFYCEMADPLLLDLAVVLDREISSQNLEYQSKRASGRLRDIELKFLLPGTGEAYKSHLVAEGQRESQFKFLRLQDRSKLTFNIDDHLIIPDDA